MTYQEAINELSLKQDLIGTTDKKGFIINEIIIVPTDEQKKNAFIQSFIITRNSMQCILPYVNDDLQLWAIDTQYLDNANVLFYDVLD